MRIFISLGGSYCWVSVCLFHHRRILNFDRMISYSISIELFFSKCFFFPHLMRRTFICTREKREKKTGSNLRQGVTRIHIVKLCKLNWIWSAITLKKRRKRIFFPFVYQYACVLCIFVEWTKQTFLTDSFVPSFVRSFVFLLYLVRAALKSTRRREREFSSNEILSINERKLH